MNIICLDAEFAENEELLELSIFDLSGREVYHNYYRPEHIKVWRTDIHHITPEMVADKPFFKEKRGEVQEIADTCFAITGFAVGNDLRVLARSGVKRLESRRVIDVRDMFWFLRGRKSGMTPFAVPSLIACAGALGLDFGEDTAHSASADTEATLRCFNLLMDEYRGLNSGDQKEEDLVMAFIDDINSARAAFVEESARGVVRVMASKEFHVIHFGRNNDVEAKNIIMEIPVADRYKAEYDIRKMLKKKEVEGKRNMYRLTPKLIEDIRRYSNEYDEEESAWCKKVLRNLSRLSL